MCVIIHKPAGTAIPHGLLTAAASLNRDGWGLMGFDRGGQFLLERHAHVDVAQLIAAEQNHRDAEIVVHLRQLTRGSTDLQNIHPLWVEGGTFLMHNGTLGCLETAQVSRSDSWHFAGEVLRPLLQRDAELLQQPAFLQLLEMALGQDNKAVLLQRSTRQIHILNRRFGAEVEGLWCSNTRWIDQRLYTLSEPAQAQERSPSPESLHFI
ncbi:class II glutamine amidotransferase [Hydrocarboniphaga sp.]|uniref:class II glutamine amidotransferase n=1 Tax=Hydrocarboniphaga sp. TaxID=2033016 RepID=UPI003D10F02C